LSKSIDVTSLKCQESSFIAPATTASSIKRYNFYSKRYTNNNSIDYDQFDASVSNLGAPKSLKD